ncbi:MAG: BPL-N domain-containing protein [candidate division Zixibacteria bacterium]|nr:BPL-N domain-containing protein [candidate division Zixibacteria bacterium]
MIALSGQIHRMTGILTAAALCMTVMTCTGCSDSDNPTFALAHADGPRAAIYTDRGCWEESVRASEKMLQWAGFNVTRIGAEFINDRGLAGFDLLLVPGGDMYRYAQSISAAGKEKIRSFINDGGGYIGICGGGYFAASRVVWHGQPLSMVPLGLYDGDAIGPIAEVTPNSDYGMCRIAVTKPDHPVNAGLARSISVLYYWGPAFVAEPGNDITVLGTYDACDQPAMMAFDYGAGRVFIIGSHPEIEEDSDRDGVTFGDNLDDEGSDWPLLKNAAEWCLDK